MPGRFKDYVAMPKFNGYRARTTVIGPAGNPLGIQIRTREMHREGRLGIAAHWLYKRGDGKRAADEDWLAWVKQLIEWGQEEADPSEFIKSFPQGSLRRRGLRLHAQGRGRRRCRPGRRRSTSPMRCTPTSGTGRSVRGERADRPAPAGDGFVEILTSKGRPRPSRATG